MHISCWSVPSRSGGVIWALVPSENYYPERKLIADDPVWNSDERQFHWSFLVNAAKTRLKPRERIVFGYTP